MITGSLRYAQRLEQNIERKPACALELSSGTSPRTHKGTPWVRTENTFSKGGLLPTFRTVRPWDTVHTGPTPHSTQPGPEFHTHPYPWALSGLDSSSLLVRGRLRL